MDRRISIGLCMAAVLLVSCQREWEPELPDGMSIPKKVSVRGVLGGDGTRTSISHNDEEARFEFHWETGDRIDLLEAVPAASGNLVSVNPSEPLPGPCDIATFSTSLEPREGEGDLHYIASYPSGALQSGSPLWDEGKGSFLLPLSFPSVQYPKAESFDVTADLLVSDVAVLMERPDAMDLSFTRLGTVFKLTLTGLASGTLVHGGSITLGYPCQGDVLFEAATATVTYPGGNDDITFRYTEEDPVTGERTGTPLVADASGKVTVWLRVRPGIADRMIHVMVDATVSGEDATYSRDINLMTRGKSVTFKEGGLTTLSVQVKGTIAGDGVIPRDLQNLPALYVDTPNDVSITDRVTWIENTRIRIVGDEGNLLFDDKAAKIRGRGNQSWNYPKKPYYFKLNKKTDLLGTGKSKKFILLANWLDRTLLRNVVAFEAARRTSLEWTPSGCFVELTTCPDWLQSFNATGPGSIASPWEPDTATLPVNDMPVVWEGSTTPVATTQASARDLSCYDIYGSFTGGVEGTTPYNTANCYVVGAPGWYRIPCVYGNAIKNGEDNPSSYTGPASGANLLTGNFRNHADVPITSPWIKDNKLGAAADSPNIIIDGAELVWQDHQKLIAEVAYDSDYLYFKVSETDIFQGNAVLAAKEGSTIVWSWHIWVMDNPETKLATKTMYSHPTVNHSVQDPIQVLSMDLGFCDTAPGAIRSRNVRVKFIQDVTGAERVVSINQLGEISFNCTYYQWGRKDPMPPAIVNTTTIAIGTGDSIEKQLYNLQGAPITRPASYSGVASIGSLFLLCM